MFALNEVKSLAVQMVNLRRENAETPMEDLLNPPIIDPAEQQLSMDVEA